MAQSSGLSSHSVLYGARYFTVVQRLLLMSNWKLPPPFRQRHPPLIGLSYSPSMSITLPSFTYTRCPQPTAQYGHTLLTILASWMRGFRFLLRSLSGLGTAPT